MKMVLWLCSLKCFVVLNIMETGLKDIKKSSSAEYDKLQ